MASIAPVVHCQVRICEQTGSTQRCTYAKLCTLVGWGTSCQFARRGKSACKLGKKRQEVERDPPNISWDLSASLQGPAETPSFKSLSQTVMCQQI